MIGGATMKAGPCLFTGAERPSGNKPGKYTGYAFFDGKALTLHNYEYMGS